jgi:hypothetical protein
MKVLDLFCGLGGWSDGFASEGFEVLGVEIERKIARLYNHPVLVADVRTLDGENFKGFDVIVGSPPCRDFSYFADRFSKTWSQNPRNIKDGLKNIQAFRRIVNDSNPTFWLMENVMGLTRFLDEKPECTPYLGGKPFMHRAFWGNFPKFLIPTKKRLPMRNRSHQKGRKIYTTSEERAKIPFPVAQALARACRDRLVGLT